MSQHEQPKRKSFFWRREKQEERENTKENFSLWKKEKEKHMRNTDFFKKNQKGYVKGEKNDKGTPNQRESSKKTYIQ